MTTVRLDLATVQLGFATVRLGFATMRLGCDGEAGFTIVRSGFSLFGNIGSKAFCENRVSEGSLTK